MLRINNYIICQECKNEFSRENYPVTLLCGHNYCKKCIQAKKPEKKFKCASDDIIVDIIDNPSIEYLNFIEILTCFPELYQPYYKPQSFSTFYYQEKKPVFQAKKPICQYFLRNTCKFGNKCWNRHNK